MNVLQKISHKASKLAIGLMSGTSVDGVDAALVKITGCGIDTKIEVLNFITFDYPIGLKERILNNSVAGQGSVDEICRLNVLIGEVFADAAISLLKERNYKSQDIDFIGSHGQTFHHLPEPEILYKYEIRSTLQLGEPSVITKRTGILTVADFRPADMAEGGLAAPLTPYFDYIMFRSSRKSRVLLNIGGIANLTLLKRDCSLSNVIAFDTGPGNMVVDYLVQKLFSKPFDENGEIALRGTVNDTILSTMLDEEYFKRQPPKTTGREIFGQSFSQTILEKAQQMRLPAEDIVATASELTVQSIWKSYVQNYANDFVLDDFIISGGGAKNKYFIKRFTELMDNVNVCTMDKLGISSDAKEAVCFAVLANETICGNPANVPSVTGAKRATILGKVCI